MGNTEDERIGRKEEREREERKKEREEKRSALYENILD